MRLDKYLKVSRLIKRRTGANEACIRFGQRTLTVEVVSVAENAGKAEAAAMYREVDRP